VPLAYNRLSVRTLPASSVFVTLTLEDTLTKLAVARLPKLALPEIKLATMLALLVNRVLVTLALPVTVKILLEESNTKFALAAKLLLLLN